MRERESPPSPTQYEACQGETEFQSTVASETVVQLERDSEKDAENYLSDDSDQSLEYCSSGDNSSDDSANVSSGAHEFVSKEVLSQSKRCSVCNNLRYRGWSATKLKPGWNCVFWTLEELEESARNGCQLCGIIREGVMRVVPTVKNPKYDELNELRYSIENTFFCPTWSDKYIRCGFHEVEFYTMPGDPCYNRAFRRANIIPGNTSSDISFQKAEKWIESCTQKHVKCGPGLESPLPTRTLDVGLDESCRTVRLVESQNALARYACLSHCWGGVPIKCQSNQKTTASYQQGISWEALPKTFQDAVTTVRRLGISFLWIDSLCILQDDTDDWQKESAQMATYYQNAYLTICAAWAGDDSQGCFSIAAPEHMAKQLKVVGPGAVQHKILVRKPLPHFNWPVSGFVPGRRTYKPHEVSVHFPALSRAWVYQERLLSPRVLHFGSAELLWECRERTNCECMPNKFYLNGNGDIYFKTSREAIPCDNHPNSCEQWRRTVEDYSALKLTFDKDKLPALSGVAKQVQNLRKERYLAGLWKETLLKDLLWISSDPTSGLGADAIDQYALMHFGRPQKRRAPSWSWASVLGPIKWYDHGFIYKAHTTVLEVHCDLLAKDTTGQVISGYVMLSGLLFSADLTNTHWSGRLNENPVPRAGGYQTYVDMDIPLCDSDDSCPHPDSKELVQCLLFASCESNIDLCLVLKCVNREHWTYERMGIARATFAKEKRRGNHELRLLSLPADAKQATVKVI